MTISNQLHAELQRLTGFNGPGVSTAFLSGGNQVDIAIDFSSVDRMSCAVRELRLSVPSMQNAVFDALRQWAEMLCRRVTYLLENIGPLELDPAAGEVLVRSTPPGQQGPAKRYYEILLKSHSNGHFTLRRYESVQGRPGRVQVDMQLTHEVLEKLLNDLLDTIPAGSP